MGFAGPGDRQGTGFEACIGVQQEKGGNGLINQQNSRMENNWRGQTGRDRSQGDVEIVGEEKFWEELQMEIRQGIVREKSIEEIIHFNPFYVVPKTGNKWYSQTQRLPYSTRSEEGSTSFDSERELTDVHEILVLRENVLRCGPTFWLELKSFAILQGNEVNSESNYGGVL
ncbi:MAG: hypothetical protein EZS28_033539, partial [Streblomastix strix]